MVAHGSRVDRRDRTDQLRVRRHRVIRGTTDSRAVINPVEVIRTPVVMAGTVIMVITVRMVVTAVTILTGTGISLRCSG